MTINVIFLLNLITAMQKHLLNRSKVTNIFTMIQYVFDTE